MDTDMDTIRTAAPRRHVTPSAAALSAAALCLACAGIARAADVATAGSPVEPAPAAEAGGAIPDAPLPGAAFEVKVGAVSFNMRWCPPGSFTMGSPVSEDGRDTDEVQHKVTLTKGFWIGETEVTQALWREVLGANPAHHKGDDLPVEQVTWNDCQRFLRKLNTRPEVRDAKLAFSLPTEAQWEYACRSGTAGPFAGEGFLDDMGWCNSNSGGSSHPVARQAPNEWGIYDMHGNVWEWCSDWFGDYPKTGQSDPTGPSSGVLRVARGGSWIHPARSCRAAFREWYAPGDRDASLGLRLVLAAGPGQGDEPR